MDHSTFSRRGGRARSAAKTAANRAKAAAYWEAVRSGQKPAPRRPRVPPSPEELGRLLTDACRKAGIVQLEVFGSVARGEARRGSDVDLIATFGTNPGLSFYALEQDLTALVGTPVHLLTRDAVEAMTNPYRRASILSDAKVIYRA